MPIRGDRFVVVAVCAALLVSTACTGDSDGGDPAASGNPSALDSYYDQEVVWGACQTGRGECTGVDVPLDYEEPDGRTLSLNVRRISAQGEADGTLFFNPGGPGGSGVQVLPWWSRGLSADVRERFDLVSFDPRGIVGSEGLRCSPSGTRRENRVPDQTPDSRAEQRKLVRWYRKVGRACIDFDPELAAHMSTAEVARDLDVLRGVLGDDRLNYVGASYGTAIGAHYADQFPDRVGRVVLDAAVDPALPESEFAGMQARGHRKVLRAYLRDCVSRRCPLGPTAQEAMATLRGYLSKLDAKPARLAGGATVTEGDARAAIQAALASGGWPGLTKALSSALDGDAAALRKLAATWYGAPPSAVRSLEGVVTLCSDSRERLDVHDVRKLADRYRRISPVFGEQFAWAQVPCGQWPVEPPSKPADLDGAGADPILVIGSHGDPITPHRHAVALANQLDSGALLTARTYGHTTYPGRDRCVDRNVDRYLLEDFAPADGLEC